jgi:ribosomal protein S8
VYKTLIFLTSFMSLSVSAAELPQQQALQVEAKAIVQQFASTLKPKLVEAIQTKGFVHAINVCSSEAPQIAKQLSADTGWDVTRVSLKPRNDNTATADEFERTVLESFEKRQQQGEPVKKLVFSILNDASFRFMKAQAVEAVCLNCHGENIQPAVMRALEKHYPNDVATGYQLGDIRGAFSLTKSLASD